MDLMDICFILLVMIQHPSYLFCPSRCSSFGHWLSFRIVLVYTSCDQEGREERGQKAICEHLT